MGTTEEPRRTMTSPAHRRLHAALPFAVIALLIGWANGAEAQGAAPAGQFPAVTVPRGQAVATSAVSFRVGETTYQVAGVRGPRINSAACGNERLRGREALKTMRRTIARSELTIRPTGATTARGNVLADILVDGASLRARLIAARTVRPSVTVPAGSNPWCVSLNRR